MDVRFDWDEHNVQRIARHGVTPAEVEEVFQNDPQEKERSNARGEPRVVVIGETDRGRRLADCLRVVTAYPLHRGDAGKRQ